MPSCTYTKLYIFSFLFKYKSLIHSKYFNVLLETVIHFESILLTIFFSTTVDFPNFNLSYTKTEFESPFHFIGSFVNIYINTILFQWLKFYVMIFLFTSMFLFLTLCTCGFSVSLTHHTKVITLIQEEGRRKEYIKC